MFSLLMVIIGTGSIGGGSIGGSIGGGSIGGSIGGGSMHAILRHFLWSLATNFHTC